MMREEAVRTLREGGAAILSWKALQFLGRTITSPLERQIQKRAKKRMIANYQDSPRYLNVGGGCFVRPHWRVLDFYSDHYDYSPLFIDYPLNLENCRRWPIDDGSYDIVYSSATLEHLSEEAVEHTVSEIFRILKPKGGLHITVPDADLIARVYEDRNEQWIREIGNHKRTVSKSRFMPCPEGYIPEYYLLRRVATTLLLDDFVQIQFEEVRNDWERMSKADFFDKYTGMVEDEWHQSYPGGHRNWFNYDKLRTLLSSYDFEGIERVYTRQSRFTELCHEGFDPRPQWSVNVEAIKPT